MRAATLRASFPRTSPGRWPPITWVPLLPSRPFRSLRAPSRCKHAAAARNRPDGAGTEGEGESGKDRYPGSGCEGTIDIAVGGGGIGGLATALHLLKRGIRVKVFEKDPSLRFRRQGFGLTLQQGGAALSTLGLGKQVAEASTWSNSHFVFDAQGQTVAFWGPIWRERARAFQQEQQLKQEAEGGGDSPVGTGAVADAAGNPTHSLLEGGIAAAGGGTGAGAGSIAGAGAPASKAINAAGKKKHPGDAAADQHSRDTPADSKDCGDAGVASSSEAVSGVENPKDAGDAAANPKHAPLTKKGNFKHNLHIPRQALREVLLDALPDGTVEFGMEIESIAETDLGEQGRRVTLRFTDGRKVMAWGLVGCDGIRSRVRSLVLPLAGPEHRPASETENTRDGPASEPPASGLEGPAAGHALPPGAPSAQWPASEPHKPASGGQAQLTPQGGGAALRYLGYMVVLGIFPNGAFPLCRSRAFQTSDGETRLFAMPFSDEMSMWQLSWAMPENEALQVSGSAELLREEALKRCRELHDPIPAMIAAAPAHLLSGYPAYDRPLPPDASALCPEAGLHSVVTLSGDAAHCMSPFKGQGANQALLDGLMLAESLYRHIAPSRRYWTKECDRALPSSASLPADARPPDVSARIAEAFRVFEAEMLSRTRDKVRLSGESVALLHQPAFLRPAFHITRKGLGGAEALAKVEALREAKVGAECGSSGEPHDLLERFAFGLLPLPET